MRRLSGRHDQERCRGRLLGEQCPREGAVASCTVSVNGKPLANTYYRSGPKAWTDASTADTCKEEGGTYEKMP